MAALAILAALFLSLGPNSCWVLAIGEEDAQGLLLVQARASVLHGEAEKDPVIGESVSAEAPKKLELSDLAWGQVYAYRYLMLDTHRDPAHKLLFCMIPKNACTEFLSLIMRMDGFSEQHWNPTAYKNPQAMVHGDDDRMSLFYLERDMPSDNSQIKAKFERRMDGTDGSDYQRGVFLRDPVHRLLSAYRSKVQTGMFEVAVKGYPVAVPRTTGFEDFVGILEQHGVVSRAVDPHILSQSALCGLNETLPYMTFVGDFDNLNEESRRLMTLIGGTKFASEMLDDGWGPNRTQSLFGVPRSVREAGAERGFMPVTEGKIAGISTMNFNSLGATSLRERATLEQGAYYDSNRLEQEFVENAARQLERDNPALVARIHSIYAADYQLISKYLPGKKASPL